MSTQREFFQDEVGPMADIVFVGCSITDAAPPLAPSGGAAPRRQVVLGGRRVKTVDVHAHCAIPEAMAVLGMTVSPAALLMAQAPLQERLRQMDAQAIDVEALSINPYWYTAERDLARQLIAIQNEKLAEFCATHSERFVAFATVALQYPDLAVEQLEYGIKRLGLCGVSVGGSVNGEELADPKFHPFWAKAEELGVLVFLHPQGVPDLDHRLQGNGLLTNVIGNPLETTIALSHLIFEGTLDRFPGLKLCAAHGGGYLPSYSARSDHGCLTFPERCSQASLKKRPSEYLRDLYFDSIVFTSEALRHLVAECGASQIVMGTDYPYPWTSTAVEHILGTPSLSDDERAAILGDTACKLLRIAS
jgi:aminocarboxymuconate-semialdehyde decarboxylase